MSFRSTSRTSWEVDVGDHDVDSRPLLNLLQDVEPRARGALHGVARIGDELQLLEHELRDDEACIQKPVSQRSAMRPSMNTLWSRMR